MDCRIFMLTKIDTIIIIDKKFPRTYFGLNFIALMNSLSLSLSLSPGLVGTAHILRFTFHFIQKTLECQCACVFVSISKPDVSDYCGSACAFNSAGVNLSAVGVWTNFSKNCQYVTPSSNLTTLLPMVRIQLY